MKKICKRIMAVCVATMILVTLPGVYILADELQEDIFIDEICEAADVPEDITDVCQAEIPNTSECVKNPSVYLDDKIQQVEEKEEELVSSYDVDQWQWVDGIKQERCTYRAWHEAYDRGFVLPTDWKGNACSWADEARGAGYLVDKNPSGDSIACWSGGKTGWGHVAYVTGVDSTYVYIREAGINPVNGKYYQDEKYKLSNQNRWSGYKLEGYIHLTSTYDWGAPKDLGDDFYANIENQEVHYLLTNENGNIVGREANGTSEQIWHFVKNSDGSYRIYNHTTNGVIDILGLKDEDDANAYVYSEYVAGSNQQFYIYERFGAYNFRPKHSDTRALDMTLGNGYNVSIWSAAKDYWHGPQSFNINKIDLHGALPINLGNDFYATIENQDNGYRLTNESGNIIGKEANGTEEQVWHFIRNNDGSYRIYNLKSNGVIDILGIKDENDANAYVYSEYVGGENQKFYLYERYGAYNIRPMHSNTKILDMNYGDGYNVTIWESASNSRHGPQSFNINICSLLSKCTVTLSPTSYIYNGSARKPSVTVKQGTTILTSGTDYTVSYANNTNAGTATVKITGKNNYTGTITKTFTIAKAAPSLKFASTSLSKKTGDAAFTNALTKTTDGAVTFKSNNTAVATVNSTSGKVTIKSAGTATITATAAEGTNYKSGSASYTLKVTASKTDISRCTITISATSYTYNGKARKPSVTVINGSATLVADTDYTVSYTNNTNAGTATVTITGKGDYTGTNSATFTINKAAAKLTFANASIAKTTKDAAFTNELTKTTDGTVTFKSSNTGVATVNSTNGLVTIKGAGTTTITATASAGTNYKAGSASYTLTVTAPSPAGFSDVQDPSHPYYKAIYWAAEAGITKGYPDGTFGINKACTRSEAVMFLWRLAGKPAPMDALSIPFKDVPKSHAHYKAILWASQKGITKGYSDGTFGINKTCTRGQIMTFIWRFKGQPAPKDAAKSPFSDVPKNHAYYKAILWGSQNKITNGFSDGTFGINKNCTRGQIVTFLYRIK